MKAIINIGFNKGPKNKRPIIAATNAIRNAISSLIKIEKIKFFIMYDFLTLILVRVISVSL